MQRLIAMALLIGVSVPAAAQEERCTEVQFERGKSSTTIHGTAPAEGAVCYQFATAAGQTVDLRVAGRVHAMSVIGIGDARDHWNFKTQARTYRFSVFQLMRAVAPAPFNVTLSIR